MHPAFSLGLSWSSESLCLLLLVIAITWEFGDREFGDHPTELVDDPSRLVSGCGQFTMTECQRISP